MTEKHRLTKAKEFLEKLMGDDFTPLISVTLGSGLKYLVELLEDARSCQYSEIPGCPVPNVTGHEGVFWWGKLNGVPVILLQGRKHLYEGCSVEDAVFLTRLVIMLDVKKLILTHATGAVTRNLIPGDIVSVWSQIAGNCPDPTAGQDALELGVEFTPIAPVFNKQFLQIARECALQKGVALHRGVSYFWSGRNFEDYAEGDAMARLGADVATMSTVPEIKAAVQMLIQAKKGGGLEMKKGEGVLDLALVTDMVENVRDTGDAVSHDEVQD
ncbi:MAG: purine-nucleoside phosphorylase, partial [Candidatus Magasanikbacteria bacterium]|nr:purine-nucleoside phosphorylase [Candidatus Magasanikbacteria bacterium]